MGWYYKASSTLSAIFDFYFNLFLFIILIFLLYTVCYNYTVTQPINAVVGSCEHENFTAFRKYETIVTSKTVTMKKSKMHVLLHVFWDCLPFLVIMVFINYILNSERELTQL